jgi:hypothetical protein
MIHNICHQTGAPFCYLYVTSIDFAISSACSLLFSITNTKWEILYGFFRNMGLNFSKHTSPTSLKQISACANKEAWGTDVDGSIWRYRLADEEWVWEKVGDASNAHMVSATNDGTEVWYLTTNNEVFSWDEELESWGSVPQTRAIKWLALGVSPVCLSHSL